MPFNIGNVVEYKRAPGANPQFLRMIVNDVNSDGTLNLKGVGESKGYRKVKADPSQCFAVTIPSVVGQIVTFQWS